MFIDEARIFVKGGNGGAGSVSFRREKHVPRGGPDGGNGGHGGGIVFEVDEGLKTLLDFKYKRHFEAGRGAHGEGNQRHGANGQNLVLKIPPGTIVKDDEDNFLFDLVAKGQRFVAVSGGHGGKGNAYFASSRRKAPSFAQKGELGQEKWLKLELKLLADVGVVGMPNVGKSTFISVISAAKPKIADYPFTTLVPNLGVVQTDSFSYVVADIPGLIEGAHKGAGLGDAFLRHVDRAGLILHMLDLSRGDPIGDFKVIDKELGLYSKELAKRLHFVVGNKTDLLREQESKIDQISSYFKRQKIPFYVISAVTKKGLKSLLYDLGSKVREIRAKEVPSIPEAEIKTYRISEQRLSDFEIVKEAGTFVIKGSAIERLVVMTDLENSEAVEYLQNQLKAVKLGQRLHKAGAQEGALVRIGSYEFHFAP